MGHSLIDCYKMRKKYDGPIWNTYRRITDSFKKLIHIQYKKDSRERVDEAEAIAGVEIIVSVIDYIERFCSDESGNKKGLNYAMELWAANRIREEQNK